MNYINKPWPMVLMLVIGLYLLPSLVRGADTAVAEIDRYIEIAYEENDKLASMNQRVQETYQQIKPAGSLENPRLQARAKNLSIDSYDFDRAPNTSKDLALMQKIPFYGKRDRREKKAIADHRIARAEMQAFQVKLAHEVRKTVFDWWEINELITLREDEKKQIKSVVEVARSQYESARGIQADLRRAQSRLSQVKNRILQ